MGIEKRVDAVVREYHIRHGVPVTSVHVPHADAVDAKEAAQKLRQAQEAANAVNRALARRAEHDKLLENRGAN